MTRRSIVWMSLAAIALTISLLLGSGWRTQGVATPTAIQLAQESSESEPSSEGGGPAVTGTYEDPQGAFQVGILDGYSVSSAAGSPLFQASDGSLAYSIVRLPLTSDVPLSEIGLVEVAEQTLGDGEGFQTQTFSTVAGGGLQIAWTGRYTQGGAPPQPISGTILVKQQGAEVYLLAVAALEPAVAQVPAVVSTLAETLTIS